MFERYTEKAIKIIMLAQEEARVLGRYYVGTEHILLGLIGEGTDLAAKALKVRGAGLKMARIEIDKITGRGTGSFPEGDPFSPRAKRLLEFAVEQARALGHNFVA